MPGWIAINLTEESFASILCHSGSKNIERSSPPGLIFGMYWPPDHAMKLAGIIHCNSLIFLANQVFKTVSVAARSFETMLTCNMLNIGPSPLFPQGTHWMNLSESGTFQSASTVSYKLPSWAAYWWLMINRCYFLHSPLQRTAISENVSSTTAAIYKADIMCWWPSI